jgi:GTP-binding protein HflX
MTENIPVKAFVIHPHLKSTHEPVEDKLMEAIELASAIELETIFSTDIPLRQKTPATYIGKGWIENITAEMGEEDEDKKPDVIIMNCSLSPVQQRNLEKAWNTKVIDRIGLILEIFGARAQTKEGKLQVELAALDYQKSRLVRSWTHLERQRGGTGKTGGPGERQIEIDRRLIGDRIIQIKRDIEKIRQNRDLQQKARDKVPYPIVAIVGYTNAGKSTLFNILTNSDILAKDMLFATLDTTMRKLELPSGQSVILSDTVGFISDLPTHLIVAFRATLEQLEYADVILHVQDIAAPSHAIQKQDVLAILKDFDIEPDDRRLINVYNKVDKLEAEDKDALMRVIKPNEVYTSAVKKTGLDTLLEKVDGFLQQGFQIETLTLSYSQGKALNWLHEHADILENQATAQGTVLKIKIHPRDWAIFTQRF